MTIMLFHPYFYFSIIKIGNKMKILMKSANYPLECHDEFVKELKPGDIVCRYLNYSWKLHHMGIYCGPRKDPHPVLKEHLEKPDLELTCPECGKNLPSTDCEHDIHVVAELTYACDGTESGFAAVACFRKKENQFRSVYRLCGLKEFMQETGALKWNFYDEDDYHIRIRACRTPLHVDEILRRALHAVANPQNEDEYDAIYYNCEHFVSWCRYGVKVSIQTEKIAKKVFATGFLILTALFKAFL